MKRRPLHVLGEVLARRPAQMRRVVSFAPLKSRDPFSGPPNPENDEEEAVDKLVRDLSLRFDLSLLVSGDRRYTQQLADEFVRELNKAARLENIDLSVVRARMLVLLPWFLRGFKAFNDRLRTALKITRERPT